MRGVTMSKRKLPAIRSGLPDDLRAALDAKNIAGAEMGDGAWLQMLQDAVTAYNTKHGTDYDEHVTVSEWLSS